MAKVSSCKARLQRFPASPESASPDSRVFLARRNRRGRFHRVFGRAEIGEDNFTVFSGAPKSARTISPCFRARRYRRGHERAETTLAEIGEATNALKRVAPKSARPRTRGNDPRLFRRGRARSETSRGEIGEATNALKRVAPKSARPQTRSGRPRRFRRQRATTRVEPGSAEQSAVRQQLLVSVQEPPFVWIAGNSCIHSFSSPGSGKLSGIARREKGNSGSAASSVPRRPCLVAYSIAIFRYRRNSRRGGNCWRVASHSKTSRACFELLQLRQAHTKLSP